MRLRNKLWTEKEDKLVYREMSAAASRGESMFKTSMRLGTRLGRSGCAVQTRFQSLRLQTRVPPIHRVVRRPDFIGAPARWLEIARKEGPVLIVDEFGKTRAILSVPGPR